MDQKRHISGAQARKRAIDKKEKEAILLSKIPRLNNFFKQINNITPSCVEDNKLESSNDITITNNCSTTSTSIQCTESSSDQSVVDINEESEKSELNVIPNPLTQNNTNNFKDPADWTNSNICRNYIAKFGYDKNIDADFTSSKRTYSDYDRYCSKSIFTKNRKNGENVSRKWLVYSISKFVLFCAPCKLFGCSTQLGDAGFNDWKNGHFVISRHENSLAHKNNTLSFITLQSDVGRIDTQLATQVTDEMNYWKAVLHRVVEVIKFLGAKGLSFREKYGNRRKGTPSYLSSTIYEELLLLMKNDIIKIILKELKAAKYYSLIVDSTPDIANVNQLVIALRYILPSGVPAERFLIFIPNSSHKSEEMSNVVMDFLNSHNIPIENCRGQNYDNARNMSGLQSRIKSFNSFAEYVPCSAHSLNLVGTCAAESCNSATSFFMLLQELYNFFSSSTARWDILKTYLKKNLSVKNLSVTCWSARFDACHALFNSYAFIIETLHSIVDNQKEKAVYKVEANGLLARLKTLETGLMICIWNSILNSFNATNKKLQSTDIDLHTVLELYNGLENYLVQIRNDFDVFENKAVEITGCSEYAKDSKRKKKRKTKELECMFSNLEIVMRMYLSTAVSNCSGERAFSVLKRVKSYLRSTMKEERLNALAIFSIEAELVEKLDFNDTINTFAYQKARKRKV
ncbi:hypothetical protein QTP88_014539 [Uroleucon formosanum]